MIDNHLKAADCSESLVRQLRPLPSESALGEEDPTTVADLSQLVESSRAASDGSDDFERALRPPIAFIHFKSDTSHFPFFKSMRQHQFFSFKIQSLRNHFMQVSAGL